MTPEYLLTSAGVPEESFLKEGHSHRSKELARGYTFWEIITVQPKLNGITNAA